jgi:hypothetical protein
LPVLGAAAPQAYSAARAHSLGANLLRTLTTLLLGAAAVISGFLLLDFGVAKYQQIQISDRAERIARLADIALSSLQSDIQTVSDLGDGHYQLAVYLLNAGGDDPIFVMLQDMRAYVQVGNVWQEVPLRPADDGNDGALRIDGRHVYQYEFDAQVRSFTQLLPNYTFASRTRCWSVQAARRKTTCSSVEITTMSI